jgi:flagellar biosynthetic protein FliQ
VSVDQAVELSRAAILLTLMMGAPVLIMAVTVGLLISIMQAVTQIQDQTISFVPKIVAMLVATATLMRSAILLRMMGINHSPILTLSMPLTIARSEMKPR